MANIVITGGPTDERIDEVMKITNMSTGKLSVQLAHKFVEAGHRVVLIGNKSIESRMFFPEQISASRLKAQTFFEERFWFTGVESTADMANALYEASPSVDVSPYPKSWNDGTVDLVIHAAAVGDYRPDFSFLMEDMANEIVNKISVMIQDDFSSADLYETVLKTLTCPECKLFDDTKISSYQQNLTVKLGLTPKIISSLREWYPNATLVGFKLLENVDENELTDVALRLCKKNDMDYVIANDLAVLRSGKRTSYLVWPTDTKGVRTLNSSDEIYENLNNILENRGELRVNRTS